MSKSPRLVTYDVESSTIPNIQKTIDIIIRENGPNRYQIMREYFTELYGKKVDVSVYLYNVHVEIINRLENRK